MNTLLRKIIPIGICVLVVIAIPSCSNAKTTVTQSGNTAGVYPNKIVVGGLATLSGVITADFAPIFDGVIAYFDMVNSGGGIYGRKLDLAYKLDDASDSSQDIDQARALVQDNVFAVVGVATPVFSGASVLVNNDVPTFGYNINPQWNYAPNLFGAFGSYINFQAPQIQVAYLAQQLHATKAAVLAYNVAQSQEGCEGAINGLKQYSIDISFQDLNISPPAVDLSADALKIKSSGAQLVVSCMDVSGNLVLSQALKQLGINDVTQYWEDGYDQSVLNNPANAELMNGVYFLIQHAPFSVGETDPQHYPGVAKYLEMLSRYVPGALPSEASLAGWVNADLFVKGLKAIGKNPTRDKLIKAINSFSNFTAEGILPPVDWKSAHYSSGSDCQAFVQVVGNQFVPRFGVDGSVFTCYSNNQKPNTAIVPVTIPDLPGA